MSIIFFFKFIYTQHRPVIVGRTTIGPPMRSTNWLSAIIPSRHYYWNSTQLVYFFVNVNFCILLLSSRLFATSINPDELTYPRRSPTHFITASLTWNWSLKYNFRAPAWRFYLFFISNYYRCQFTCNTRILDTVRHVIYRFFIMPGRQCVWINSKPVHRLLSDRGPRTRGERTW